MAGMEGWQRKEEGDEVEELVAVQVRGAFTPEPRRVDFTTQTHSC